MTKVKNTFEDGRFIEILVTADDELLLEREKSRPEQRRFYSRGLISLSDHPETRDGEEIVIDTGKFNVEECVDTVIGTIESMKMME